MIDRSASMSAGGAFQAAREKTTEAIDSLLGFRVSGTTPEVMLVAVDSQPHIVVPFTKDRARLQEALRSLEPSDVPDALEELRPFVASLIKAHKAKVWLFGDRLPPSLKLAGLQFTSVATGDNNNVGIVSFSVRNPDPDRGQAKPFLYARVENFSATAQQRVVRLEKLKPDNPEAVEALVLERNLLLAADSGQTVVEAVPAFRFKTDQSSLFRLSVVAIPDAEADILSTDDRAYCVVAPFQKSRVLVATSPGVKADFLLRAIAASSGIKVVQVKELLALENPPTIDLLLTPAGASIPSHLKVRSRFTLAAKPTTDKVRAEALRVSNAQAPMVADCGVEWNRLKVELTDFTPLANDEVSLLETARGPALSMSGVGRGLPSLHWRFPLAYSSLPLSPALPVVVGRFIDQYSRPSGVPVEGSITTSTLLPRPNGPRWQGELKLSPVAGTAAERAPELSLADQAPAVSAPEFTGLFTLQSQMSKASEQVAVNLFSYKEGRLQRDFEDANFESDPSQNLEEPAQAENESVQYRAVGLPFLILALLFLLFEAALFLKRGRP